MWCSCLIKHTILYHFNFNIEYLISILFEFLFYPPGVQLMVAAGFSLQDESAENGEEDKDSPGLIILI